MLFRFEPGLVVPLLAIGHTVYQQTVLTTYFYFIVSYRLVLRIRSDATVVQFLLGNKFGCDITSEAPTLLRLARSLDLNVIGICFHVGSGCGEPAAYRRSIAAAYTLFELATNLGFRMELLDIGGGYAGHKGSSIDEVL